MRSLATTAAFFQLVKMLPKSRSVVIQTLRYDILLAIYINVLKHTLMPTRLIGGS